MPAHYDGCRFLFFPNPIQQPQHPALYWQAYRQPNHNNAYGYPPFGGNLLYQTLLCIQFLTEGREGKQQIAHQAYDHGNKELLVAHHLAVEGGEEGIAVFALLLDEGDDIFATKVTQLGQVTLESSFLELTDILEFGAVGEGDLVIIGHAVQAVCSGHGAALQMVLALEVEYLVGDIAGFVNLHVKDIGALGNAGDDFGNGGAADLNEQADIDVTYRGAEVFGIVKGNLDNLQGLAIGLGSQLRGGGIGNEVGALLGIALAREGDNAAIVLGAIQSTDVLGNLIEDELVVVVIAQRLVEAADGARLAQEGQHQIERNALGQSLRIGQAHANLNIGVVVAQIPRAQVELLHLQLLLG